jgi:oligoribonuclease NrnB/cAMP/cGMP phosphodiesterase (DHH superfamily)
MVDLDNVVIIDHHTTHVNNKHKYTKAKHFIKEETSCCKHIYNLLHKQSDVQLTDQQKHLLLLVDDYDCYKLQLQGSHDLNLLFWNYQGDRVAKFITEFKDGFHGFTDDQLSIIKFYKKAIQETISNLDIFTATIPIGDNTYNIVSTFASKHINDVAHHIINDNGADVGIVVNLESKKVSFRKDKAIDIDLSKLANKLASGGGHKYAAGGLLTDTFMSFSKLFKPLS